MLEERLRWCIVRSRWLDKAYYTSFREISRELVPSPLKIIFPLLAKRNQKRIAATLKSNGIGKFTAEEVYRFGQRDLDAVATILGDKPYLLGDRPSSHDAVVYAFLTNLIDVPIECPLNTFARNRANLRNYCQKMKNNYFDNL